jgi:hypothetical protein
MASLIKKTIRGKPYYYARECKRVDGKPKIVWQKYLGRPQDIVDAVTRPAAPGTPAQPKEAAISEFGAVVALYDLALRLRIVQFIDRHVPKRGNGPTVGTYLLVAALNRCVAPCSKAGIGEWFDTTALRRLLDVETRQLTSQRFWDNMDRVSQDAIAAIERDLVAHMVREFDIDLRRVLFDATNFFTFIDTFNERSTLAQRGKSKEGRTALRIVGLALLVSADFHVPLMHRTYPGNQADAPTFSCLVEEIVARYRLVTDNENLFVAQSQTLLREITKRQVGLRALQHQLRRRGRRCVPAEFAYGLRHGLDVLNLRIVLDDSARIEDIPAFVGHQVQDPLALVAHLGQRVHRQFHVR